MGLKILCAGCSAEEREAAEAAVRRALGTLPGSWMVSLVKVRNQWSVTLDGPDAGRKGLTLVVPEGRLKESIQEALNKPAKGERAPVAAAAGPEKRDRQQCQKCGRPFAVVYPSAPGEGVRTVQVACPHCWHVGHFPVAEEAALNRDYRAEKVE